MQGKLINLKGQVFGTLTVIRRSYPWETPGYGTDEHRRKTRQARWVCQCACGGIKILISQNLRRSAHGCNCKPAVPRREGERSMPFFAMPDLAAEAEPATSGLAPFALEIGRIARARVPQDEHC